MQPANWQQATMEFHVSRRSRDHYQFDESLFALSGNVIFANFYAARVFAQKINHKRDLVSFPERAVRAGQINALGLIDEMLHHVMQLYREQRNPQAVHQALLWLYDHLGQDAVDKALYQFADQFPPLVVYRREITLDEYLQAATGGVPNRASVLEELVMLWLSNVNPACSPLR